MAKGNAAGNGTNHNNSAAACPNSAGGAHLCSKASAPRLPVVQVRAALAVIDLGPGSLLHRAARYYAWLAQTDPDDLLQDALVRAVTTRSCPAHVQVERYLRGIMRSLASGIVAKRERGREGSELARAAEEERLSNSILSPDEELDRRKRARVCQDALARISEGHHLAEMVIDGIGQGLRGKALEEFADTDTHELANIRRLIKRRAVTVWDDLYELDRYRLIRGSDNLTSDPALARRHG